MKDVVHVDICERGISDRKDRAGTNGRLSLRERSVERAFRGAKDDTKKPLDPKMKRGDEDSIFRYTERLLSRCSIAFA